MYTATPEGKIWSHKTNRYLKPSSNGSGYQHVVLRLYGESVDVYVHRFIAENLIPNPDDLPEVNHINGDKSDNRVENLEWVSSRRNKQHAYDIGLRTFKKVRQHYRGGTMDFPSAREAAEYYDINEGCIRSVCNGDKKSYQGCKWSYIE